MSEGLNRRELMAAGGAAVAAAALPAPATGASRRAARRGERMFFFDPTFPAARNAAAMARGHRRIALGGDPVRLWRNAVPDHPGSISGVTSWSDYVVLRGLAEEIGRRIDSEKMIRNQYKYSLVIWRLV